MKIIRRRSGTSVGGLRWPRGSGEWAMLPQQMPHWLSVFEKLGEEAWQLVCHDDGNVAGWLTYTISRSDLGVVVSSLPYLPYGGPVSNDRAIEEVLLGALVDEARALGADVVSVASHPLMGREALARWQAALKVTHSFDNFVQLQSLARHPVEVMKSRSRAAFNRKFRRAEDAGVTVCLAESAEDVEAWLEIYRCRFDEIGGRPYPPDFFRFVFRDELLRKQSVQLWLAKIDKKVIGGTWIFMGSQCADYFASAFDSGFNDCYPSTLVMNVVFQSLVARSIPVLNWQSSPGRGGVYEFKRRWGAEEGSHAYHSVLLNSTSRILQASPQAIGDNFPFRFVVPFSVLGEGAVSDSPSQPKLA